MTQPPKKAPLIEQNPDEYIHDDGTKWSIGELMRNRNAGPAIVGQAKFEAREAWLKKSDNGRNGPGITVEGYRHPTDPPPCTPEEHEAKVKKAREYLASIRALNRPSPMVR